MDQRIVFRQLLDELKALAEEQDGVLSTDQVRDCLQHAQLSEEQLEMVYAYLAEQRIEVDGWRNGEGIGSDGRIVLETYLQEIGKINMPDPMLEEELFRRAAAGDREARDTLARAYLPLVCDMAGELESDLMPVEDLIQEGNVGLLTALDALQERSSLAAWQAQLLNAVAAAMQDAVRDQKDRAEGDQDMADKVNRLSARILELKEELGHEVTAEELSAYLDLPLEEIDGIIRLAGDEMKS